MKDQSTAALNALSQAGSTYTNFMMHYMQTLTDMIVKENAKMIEQTQSEFQAIAQAKTPAEVMQLASEHMVKTTNESLAFAWKIYTLGYEEQSQLLAAVQKQLADSSASWQSMMDKMPSGSFAAPGLMLNAVKSALEMGHHALETTQATHHKTAALLNESLNGAGQVHAPSQRHEAKSSRRSAQA